MKYPSNSELFEAWFNGRDLIGEKRAELDAALQEKYGITLEQIEAAGVDWLKVADRIEQKGYPNVTDNGEVSNIDTRSTREKFADAVDESQVLQFDPFAELKRW